MRGREISFDDATRAPGISLFASSRSQRPMQRRTGAVVALRKSLTASELLLKTSTWESIVALCCSNLELAVPVIVNMEKSMSTPGQVGSSLLGFGAVRRTHPRERS